MLLPYYQANQIEAGCDEAGRGCLAGAVFAAAVILPTDFQHPDLNDSKQLSERKREELRKLMEKVAISYAVAKVEVDVIDTINILQAAQTAMHLAVAQLTVVPQLILVDGNYFRPYPEVPHRCIIKGDGIYASIAAASILAKTYRDAYMRQLHAAYPAYDWEKNKGYPTAKHRAAIKEHGLTPHHRKSFKCEL